MLLEGFEACPLTSLKLAHLFKYDFYPLHLDYSLMSAASLTKQSAAEEQAPVSYPLGKFPKEVIYSCMHVSTLTMTSLLPSSYKWHHFLVSHRNLSLSTPLPILSGSQGP